MSSQQTDLFANKDIYVGNLPSGVQHNELEECFSKFGRVELISMPEQPAHWSKFAFIKFQNKSSAADAYSSGQKCPIILNGRKLRIGTTKSQNNVQFNERLAIDQQPIETFQLEINYQGGPDCCTKLERILRSFQNFQMLTFVSKQESQYFEERDYYSPNGHLANATFTVPQDDIIKDSQTAILDILKRINDEISRYQIDSNMSVSFKSDEMVVSKLYGFELQFGNLTSPNYYYYNPALDISLCYDNLPLVWNDKQNRLEIEFPWENQATKLHIPLHLIEDRILFVSEQDDRIELIIPCSKPPLVVRDMPNLNDDTKRCSRYFLPNSSWAMKMSFRSKLRVNLISLIKQLALNFRMRLVFAHIDSAPITYTMQDLREDFSSTCFDTRYYLECLISQHEQLLTEKVSSSFFVQILNDLEAVYPEQSKILPKVIENFAEKLENYKNVRFHSNIYELLQDSIDEVTADQQTSKGVDDTSKVDDLGGEMVWMKNAVVTPTKIIFYFPVLTQSNRVTREFGAEKFLRIRFLDDDTRPLILNHVFFNMDRIALRIKAVLTDGIEIGDRRYQFLAMSSSQLRSHGCWMVCERADEIRNWMGDFSAIRCVGKYAARLGQSLSTSIEGFASSEYSEIPDVFVTHNGIKYNFTDGIGKISLAKAIEIMETLELESLPSAFQIRYRGYKGVVSVDPTIDLRYANANPSTKQLKSIQLRKSMCKFESDRSTMDILQYSCPIPCHLNRQVILMLSALGIEDKVFDYFLDLMLKRLISIFTDPQVARDCIKAHYESQRFTKFLHKSKNMMAIDYAQEPFFHDILASIYRRQSEDLINKSRIFIANGRLLLGTIDEWNVLEEDEVFIQCTKMETDETGDGANSEKYYSTEQATFKLPNVGETFILDCPVVVTKNPAMVAGDLRIMRAVHKKELEHMVDCIVFPAKGYRPITDMCSGSDLDGDQYWVSWDELLIPTRQEKPFEFDSGKSKELERPVNINDIIDFFVGFMKNGQLGNISTEHTALADSCPDGIRDENCKILAEMFYTAVDFAKTGILPKSPKECGIQVDKYPDFMERNPDKTYKSEKIIGKMYRKCKSAFMNEDATVSRGGQPIELNRSLIVQGYEKYLSAAIDAYSRYRKDIERIMKQFAMNKEYEIFLGKLMVKGSPCGPVNQDEEKDMNASCQKLLRRLWIRMRKQFFSEFADDVTSMQISIDEPAKKAYAWYHACYTSDLNQSKRILSFPWIVKDFLLKPVSSRQSLQLEKIRIEDTISKLICQDYIDYCERHEVHNQYELKLVLLSMISNTMSKLGSNRLFIDHLDEYLLPYKTGSAKPMDYKFICSTSDIINDQFLKKVFSAFHQDEWKNCWKTTSLQDATISIANKMEWSILIKFVSQKNTNNCVKAYFNADTIKSIRLRMVQNPALAVIAYIILKMMQCDAQLMTELGDGETFKESTAQFVILMIIEFCKSRNYFQGLDKSPEGRFSHLMALDLSNDDTRLDFLDHLLACQNMVRSRIENLAGDDRSKVSAVLMAFYKENAFELADGCPVSLLVQQVSFDSSKLDTVLVKALREHFFKGIHILVRTQNIASSSFWEDGIKSQFEKLNGFQNALNSVKTFENTAVSSTRARKPRQMQSRN